MWVMARPRMDSRLLGMIPAPAGGPACDRGCSSGCGNRVGEALPGSWSGGFWGLFNAGGAWIPVLQLSCLKDGPLLVALAGPEALGGLEHAGGSPTRGHLRVAPALHVTADLPDNRVRRLDAVGAGQRAMNSVRGRPTACAAHSCSVLQPAPAQFRVDRKMSTPSADGSTGSAQCRRTLSICSSHSPARRSASATTSQTAARAVGPAPGVRQNRCHDPGGSATICASVKSWISASCRNRC